MLQINSPDFPFGKLFWHNFLTLVVTEANLLDADILRLVSKCINSSTKFSDSWKCCKQTHIY